LTRLRLEYHLHAFILCRLRLVGAVEKASFEELYSDDGEDELKEHVDDHNIEHVLQRVDDAVEHSLSKKKTTKLRLEVILSAAELRGH